MVVAVVRRGRTPFPKAMFGVMVPDQRMAAAPPPDLPVEK
jgi:hypothetical protein